MSSEAVIKRTFAPAALVGHVYARERGATTAPMPIGNVLELELSLWCLQICIPMSSKSWGLALNLLVLK